MVAARLRWTGIRLAGVILICVGIGCYAVWYVWVSTRVDRPVNMPISLAVGRVQSPAFKVNRNAPYLIQIEVQKKLPFDTLNCLLGTAMAPASTEVQECPDRPSVVKASWVLVSDGTTIAAGASDDKRAGIWGNQSISRILGTFEAESGRSYALLVDVLADGSALGPGNPHLKVEVSSAVYEDEMVEGAILSLAMVILVVVGVVLLFIARRKTRRTRSAAADPVSLPNRD